MNKLCHINDIIDPGSKQFSLKIGRTTIELFVVHKDSGFYAYKNSCPHTGASLNWNENEFLDLDKALIQCSVHDALFEIDSGYCISGPCSGSSMEELKLEIIDGVIFLMV